MSGSILFGGEQCADKTPLTYHETKSSICYWYLIMKDNIASVDHARSRCGYPKIPFTTLNVIRKMVITKVMVGYSESTL
jgi:hypothetical protein